MKTKDYIKATEKLNKLSYEVYVKHNQERSRLNMGLLKPTIRQLDYAIKEMYILMDDFEKSAKNRMPKEKYLEVKRKLRFARFGVSLYRGMRNV